MTSLRSILRKIDKDDIMESIVVSNIPPGTKEEALVIHFQQRKHGGGDVSAIKLTQNATPSLHLKMKKVSCEWINSTFYLTLFLFLVTWTIEDYRPIVIQSNDSRQKTIGGSVLFSIINLHRAKTDLKRCFNLMAIFYDSHTIANK